MIRLCTQNLFSGLELLEKVNYWPKVFLKKLSEHCLIKLLEDRIGDMGLDEPIYKVFFPFLPYLPDEHRDILIEKVYA